MCANCKGRERKAWTDTELRTEMSASVTTRRQQISWARTEVVIAVWITKNQKCIKNNNTGVDCSVSGCFILHIHIVLSRTGPVQYLHRHWLNLPLKNSAVHISVYLMVGGWRPSDLDGDRYDPSRTCNDSHFSALCHMDSSLHTCIRAKECAWKCLNTRPVCMKQSLRDQVSIFSCFLKSFMSW